MEHNKTNGVDFFVDLEPEIDDFRMAVLDGLSKPQKSIPAKFFYDRKGSQLFDLICEAPEYYVTRTELGIIEDIQSEVRSIISSGVSVIEYGCGSSLKIRALLSALSEPAEYIAIEISKSHLITTATQIALDYPDLSVGGICADFSQLVEWPQQAKKNQLKRLAFFPGSTIGNQTPQEAGKFLKDIRHMLGDEGKLIIGVDLKKDVDVLTRAYNDVGGYTADFNLNLLHRIKSELNADLDISTFSHNAFYNEQAGRVEMHLVSQLKQVIQIDEIEFSFEAGESIHTENSYKYSQIEFTDLAAKSGFDLLKSWSDRSNYFAVYCMQAS
jgi:dimethylhistidine N-methyltransferase